ncbi:hypothetical protein [Puniceibacterium sp. IMCC21224]|uniref:hypothetical protein n=1 Tax=Puniceibacterium sp. IMCC21224 TaxID=1618204 RepID=UPI00065DAFE8|nr:hypothetical protein [Puniceibacterium sp. IMCC21224]KMK67963.1 hypothetical protein IMCC21224_112840 [Puniceibacterium sp. IMCC21224]
MTQSEARCFVYTTAFVGMAALAPVAGSAQEFVTKASALSVADVVAGLTAAVE